jgi:glycosyltransferase involved in cell wall biosynthesis
MNVLFDPQVFSFQEHGGISRYYYQLFKTFLGMEGITPELIIRYSNNRYITNINDIHVKQFFPAHRFKGRNEIIKLLNRMFVRKNFHRQLDLDIFHPTYYHPYFLDFIGDIPFVLTIYDMAHEHYPRMFSRFDFTSEHKKKVALKANRIIAISEHTKNDIVTLLKIPASKIDVIPLATTLSRTDAKVPSIPVPNHFILYVGKRNTYKNFFFLLQALRVLFKTDTKYSLVCAGGGTFTKHEIREIERLHLSGRIIQIHADDTLLAYLYSKARAFVYPSLYEGFGIPVLEAFACACPAIVSNRSSLPEVGGDAAQYFDPENQESLVTALSEVLNNNDAADHMREKGLERVKLFSWDDTAQKTLETYKKVLR